MENTEVLYPNLDFKSQKPNLLDVLATSPTYGHNFNPIVPPESKEGSPTERNVTNKSSVINIKKVRTTNDDLCHICARTIDADRDIIVQVPGCSHFYHFQCYTTLGWNKINPKLICPTCIGIQISVTRKNEKKASQRKSRSPHYKGDCTSSSSSSSDEESELKAEEESSTKLNKMKLFISDGDVKNLTKTVFSPLTPKLIGSPAPEIDLKYMNQYDKNIEDLLDSGYSIYKIIQITGAQSLEQLYNLGLSGRHLTRIQEFRKYLFKRQRFYATNLRRVLRVTIQDLYTLRSKTLKTWDFNVHEMCLMGLTKKDIPKFTYISLNEWVNVLEFDKVHIQILDIERTDFSGRLGLNWNSTTLKELLHLSLEEALEYNLLNQDDLVKHYMPHQQSSTMTVTAEGSRKTWGVLDQRQQQQSKRVDNVDDYDDENLNDDITDEDILNDEEVSHTVYSQPKAPLPTLTRNRSTEQRPRGSSMLTSLTTRPMQVPQRNKPW